MPQVDLLIHSAAQVATCASPDGPRRGAAMADVGLIPNAAVAVSDGEIVAVGPSDDLLAAYTARQTIDAGGKVVCPGFVDPHTHVVYAGDRVGEFELRIKGATYMEIMRAGGGIVSTMKATRAAPVERLVQESRPRLDAMLALGTTTIEVKTGYGLDTDSELNMLSAIAALDAVHPADLVPTFLAAHAVPPEFKNDPDGYLDLVITEILPRAADWHKQAAFKIQNSKLFCDVFCEAGVFDREQSRRVLSAGLAHGLPPKIHADEFQNLGGVSLAVELGAVSADHLDVTPPEEVAALAASDTVGVVLPAVNFNLGSTHFADARAIVDAGAALALATDINPGSAPCPSMPLVMAMACRYQRLLPAEALNASTINAAYAVGLGDRLGSLEPGKQADLLIVDAPDYRHLAYQFGVNLVQTVIKRGRVLTV
ncbi:MAG: imidazolonepropionase [Chloroflexi bacterium]|nr:MAG: imidazolonepropionase [Chloroflexota bacterium]